MRDPHLISIERKIARIRAEKRAGLAILCMLSVTTIIVVLLNLDSTLRMFGTSGHLGV